MTKEESKAYYAARYLANREKLLANAKIHDEVRRAKHKRPPMEGRAEYDKARYLNRKMDTDKRNKLCL